MSKKNEPQDEAVVNAPAATDGEIPDWSGASGAGMENADSESYAMPFLRALQPTSPEADESDASYINGAMPGMLLNTVNKQLIDGKVGAIFLPCHFERKFLRWGPRDSDRGYMGEYGVEEVAALQQDGSLQEHSGKLIFVNKETGECDPEVCDRLTDTRNHYGMIFDAETGATQPVLLSLTSTQIKKSKNLMMLLSQAKAPVPGGKGLATPPTWLNQIRIKTVREKNAQGSWFGVTFEAEGFLKDAGAYGAAAAFHDSIKRGAVKVDREAEAAAEGAGKF